MLVSLFITMLCEYHEDEIKISNLISTPSENKTTKNFEKSNRKRGIKDGRVREGP